MQETKFQLCVICVLITAATAMGQIVSVNPGHNNPNIPGAEMGFETDPNIHVIAYHPHTLTQVTNCMARGALYNKPIIISDDNKTAVDVPLTQSKISQTFYGGEHYEHFDVHLGDNGAMTSAIIDGEEDFPYESITVLNSLGTYASTLSPGGTLTVHNREFYWNGQPVTLMGSSWMGAMVGLNFSAAGYLDVLANHGVNLTRQWCIEQWTATCNGSCTQNSNVPFAGTYQNWNLDAYNDAYYDRMKEFIQAAWARGIVVQLTLFDRHGVSTGMWSTSPYNAQYNNKNFLVVPTGEDYPPFVDLAPAPIWDVNEAFIYKTMNELKGFNNVIYEIMNEPADIWANHVPWHIAIAQVVVDAYESNKSIDVSIDMGTTDTEEGLTNIQAPDGYTAPADIGERNCKTNTDPATDHYFYFGIDRLYEGSEPQAWITIDYYDTGSGSLVLEYDSNTGDDIPAIDKNGGSISLTGSNTWKQHTFHITDAYFGDRQNMGADFRITRSETGPMYLDTVTVVSMLPPTITQQPSSQKLHKHHTAHFTVATQEQEGLAYQWQRNGINLQNNANISGAYANTLQITNVNLSNEGDYRCVITNTGGSTISDTAALTLTVLGDFDVDDDVDLEDFGHLQTCFTGSLTPQQDPLCQDTLLNNDDIVDLIDFGIFQNCLSGTNIPASQDCDD